MEECIFYTTENGDFYVTSQIQNTFNKHGYILIRGLFNIEEITKLKEHFETNPDIKLHAYGRSDGRQRYSKICLWNNAGDDLSGVISR